MKSCLDLFFVLFVAAIIDYGGNVNAEIYAELDHGSPSTSFHDEESISPLVPGHRGEHFLNQLGAIAHQENYNTAEKQSTKNPTRVKYLEAKILATPVYIAFNVRSIRSISPSEESYQLRCHVYMMWGVNFDKDPLWAQFKSSLYEKAVPLEYYALKDGEMEALAKAINLPTFRFANAKEVQETDSPSIRVYANNGNGTGIGTKSSMVMWNQGFQVVLANNFPLQEFPFDYQTLLVSMRQDDSRSWDMYNFTVAIVQFNVEALHMAEWDLYEPSVRRGSPGHKEAKIHLHVRRDPGFFITNVCMIIGMLSATGLIVFTLGTDDLNDRINVILTLLLTAVAFKFVIADAIPKVGYSTRVDSFVILNMGFLFAQIVMCAIAHHFEHGVHEDDADDAESPSHLMATHLPYIFQLSESELELRVKLNYLIGELDEFDLELPSLLTMAQKKKVRNLRWEMKKTKDAIHDFASSHWTVNQFMFVSNLVTFGCINGWWCYSIYQGIDKISGISLEEEVGRNWYALSFANPSFLLPPGSTKRCVGNCPAGW
eukprot:g10781.t1